VSREACPFCGSADDNCVHYLGEVDHTFGEVSGIEELERLSGSADQLDAFFKKNKTQPEGLPHPLLADLFVSWKKTGSIDKFILPRLIVSLLLEAGARKAGSSHSGFSTKQPDSSASLPGFTSAVTALFADNPKAVVVKANLKLNSYLS